MSRQNKVNPGMYTQRGRLAQDDVARELKRQRVVGSPHTWQPVQRDRQPALTVEPDRADANEEAADAPTPVAKAPARPKAARAAKPTAAKAAKKAKRPAAPGSRRTVKTTARTAGGAKKAKAKTAAKPKAKRVRRSG